jgi:outer membrane protein TolC
MRVAQQQLKAKALDIVGEGWGYFYGLKSAVQKLDSAQDYEQSALESAKYAQEAYENGLCSFTDLLTSQNALSSARRQLIYAKNGLSMSWVNLAYCTGRILEK